MNFITPRIWSRDNRWQGYRECDYGSLVASRQQASSTWYDLNQGLLSLWAIDEKRGSVVF